MDPLTANIESKLRLWQLAFASRDDTRMTSLSNEIYKVVFAHLEEPALWDERVLLGLKEVLAAMPPDPKVYGTQVQAILKRADTVKAINDLFFMFLDTPTPVEDVLATLAAAFQLSDYAIQQLRSDSRLVDLRREPLPPSAKLQTLVQHIAGDSREHTGLGVESLSQCIEAVRRREEIGTANALLVHKKSSRGIVLPIMAAVQRGSGQVRMGTPAGGVLSGSSWSA